eukprot:1154536-Pelagomonas_calceolata.AAC.6
MSILFLPKTVAPKHSSCAQSFIGSCSAPAPVQARVLHVSCTASGVPSTATSNSNQGSTRKRQPRRHERDALKEQARVAGRSSGPTWIQQPASLDATDDSAVLAAIASCRNEQELHTLYAFLRDQQQQQANGHEEYVQSPPSSQTNHLDNFTIPSSHALPQAPTLPDSSPLQPPPHNPHSPHQQHDAQEHKRLPPQQAVHLLARLSQLSPSPALAITPPLDTTLAYDPLPQANSETRSSSSSAPAGYVQPQSQPQQLHQQQVRQQQPQRAQAHRGGAAGSAADKDRGTEVAEEEQAEDAESARAMQKR